MSLGRQHRYGYGIRAASVTMIAGLALWLLPTPTAFAVGPSPSPSPVASAPIPSCLVSQFRSTQDHIGRIAEVSSINQLDPVTATIFNDGVKCGHLTASLTLDAATNQSGVVWPEIYWSVDGGPWTASSSSQISCQSPGPSNCIRAELQPGAPIASGQTTVAVALDFTSWNDALYSFAGSIALYGDGNESPFGLDSTNDWLLNCPTCSTNGTTVLPPGSTAAKPPATSGGGSTPQSPASAATGAGESASAAPAASSASGAASTSASASSSMSAASTYSAVAPSSSSSTTSIRVAPVASDANDSVPWFVGVGVVAIIASAGGALFVARKRRRADSSSS